MEKLTHFDAKGDAHMVDISPKGETRRTAVARGRILMKKDTLELIKRGDSKKGDVLNVARIAGIMASKKTPELIPLAHGLDLTKLSIDFEFEEEGVICTAKAETLGRTGVEMEALTAASISLLTIYDMCKSVDRGMKITDLRLLEKTGGASGHWVGK